MLCDNCNKLIPSETLKVRDYKQLKHKFCKQTCYQEWWDSNVAKKFNGKGNVNWKGGEITKKCLVCVKEFRVLPYRRNAKFCSHRCSAKFHFTGSKNPNWMGGIEREERDNLPGYREWRTSVWMRDKNTCQLCKHKGKKIIAHHIKVYKHFPKNRIEVENGITLCRSCHMRLHATHKKTIDFTEILRDYMPNMG